MKSIAVCLLATVAVAASAQSVPSAYASVLTTLDRQGDYKDGVLRISIPRNDLMVKVDGNSLPTPFGFGGWIAMTKGDKNMNVMMGDLVLLEDEVNPVMSALLTNGLEVTALHNHFFWDEPKVFYMHVHGMGTPDELARKVKPALDLIGHVAPIHPIPMPTSEPSPSAIVAGTLDTKALDAIVGTTGDMTGQVYKYTVGRNDLHVKEMGAVINSRMGLNTWASLYGSDSSAVIAGDVAMLENEVTPVLKALRAHDIDVVAIHQHMTGMKPMVVFLHFYGKGAAADLARGFKAALDELGKKPMENMNEQGDKPLDNLDDPGTMH